MKKYALVKDGVVTQTQPNKQDGFIEVAMDVTCGMLQTADGFTNPEQPLDTLLNRVENQLNKDCKAAIEGGFNSTALGTDHTYPAEIEDQLNISGNVLLATDTVQKCTDSAGVKEYRPHTALEMRKVGEDLAAHKMAQLQKVDTLKKQAKAAAEANDRTALQAIAWG